MKKNEACREIMFKKMPPKTKILVLIGIWILAFFFYFFRLLFEDFLATSLITGFCLAFSIILLRSIFQSLNRSHERQVFAARQDEKIKTWQNAAHEIKRPFWKMVVFSEMLKGISSAEEAKKAIGEAIREIEEDIEALEDRLPEKAKSSRKKFRASTSMLPNDKESSAPPSPLAEQIKILIIDDDRYYGRTIENICESFEERKVTAVSAQDLMEALEHMDHQNFDIALVDYDFGVGRPNGLQIIKDLKQSDLKLFACLHSSHSPEEVLNQGADLVLPKGLTTENLKRLLFAFDAFRNQINSERPV